MRLRRIVLLAVAALALGACGTADPAAAPGADEEPTGTAAPGGGEDPTDPAVETPTDEPGSVAGMCAPDVTDCVDTVVDPEGDFDVDAAVEEAVSLIGLAEDELPEGVRVGRRGDEDMILTEDYVLGRDTVELQPDDSGVFRVTAVTVELPEGPEVVTGDPRP